MILQKLFTMQHELDQYIATEHGLQGEDLIEKKILALLVEVGELANETRCFKFWSKQAASERAKILEEYVDGVHFILSIGLELGYSDQDLSLDFTEKHEDVVQGFLTVYNQINALQQTKSVAQFEKLLGSFFALGQSLGFTLNDVHQAYIQKNEINYQRQQAGY